MKNPTQFLILAVVLYVAFAVTIPASKTPIAHTRWHQVDGYTIELIGMQGDILSVSIQKADSIGYVGYNAEKYNFTEDTIRYSCVTIDIYKESFLRIKKSASGGPDTHIFQCARNFFDIY
jgi:hypothetical protein